MDINDSRNNLEYIKAMLSFYTNVEKGWITTEEGQHLFIGGDGILHGGKSAYDASKGNSRESSSDNGSSAPDIQEYGEPIAFESLEAAKEYFGKDWEYSITDDQRDAVVRYTGSWHAKVNKNLRNGVNLEDMDSLDAYQITEIDDALATSTLNEPITVYRGAGPEMLGFEPPISAEDVDQLVGSIITDNGFVSTSTDKKTAASFNSVLNFNITVPPGTGRGAYIAGISRYEDESEFLMPRGTSFVVTGVSKDANDKILVDMVVFDE